MPLTTGTRLGAYVIDAPIGAGGMGEVYRARDTTLQRDVAIKILPDVFAADPERLARFSREAQTLAALNHPNIAQIYGLEGTALVMELVEGLTLAEMISGRVDAASGSEPWQAGAALSRRDARQRGTSADGGGAPSAVSNVGPHRGLSIDDALPIARQIVEALDAAHGRGIVHRDLKPANIKVTPDGTVKVLDFGLAKAWGGSSDGEMPPFAGAMARDSPTFTNAAMTHAGMILGTAAYMSPEQAKGRSVDKRADIWAFGCVLFEMLTGKMVFPGEDVTETLAAVVRGEPDWTALPADTPVPIRRLLRRCLTKDVKERLSDIGVAKLEISDALDTSGSAEPTIASPEPRRSTVTWWIPAAALVSALATVMGAWLLWPAPPVLPTLSLTIDWPVGLRWIGPSGPGVAVSPAGTHIAYMAFAGKAPRLFVHSLSDDQSHAVPGSEDSYGPFFSPDSTQVGFTSAGKLWRTSITGGTPFEIGGIDQGDRGVAWSSDGYLYSGGGNGISRILETGGTREALTSVNRAGGEVAHRFPAILPGGRAILFTIFKGALDDARLAVLDLTTKKWRLLMDRTGHSGQYTSSGHIVYLRAGVLMAAPFDVSRLDVTGPPVPVLDGVLYNNGGAGHFSVSNAGTLVYVPDVGWRAPAEVVWVDRAGRLTPIDIPHDPYRELALSRDGTRIALVRMDASAKSTIVVWDFGRRALTTMTGDSGVNAGLVWMPSGDSLVYASRPQVGGLTRMVRQRADGVGNPAQVSTAPIEQTFGSSREFPGSISPDGTKLLYTQEATTSDGIKSLDLATSRVEMLVPSRGGPPRVSPDGRWLAYESYESDSVEIYVRPYPEATTARWQVSTGGGRWPHWSRDGRELFYRGIGEQQSRMFVVSVDPASGFQAVRPQVLFEFTGSREAVESFRDFDVALDGRFLMLVASQSRPPIPHVIVNWFETLKRPAAR